jgi:large conductance mechanosensitive channel
MIGKFISEFKAFAMKGNVLDMAVGVVIGAAFGKIVASLVDNIMMPLIGAVGKVEVADLWKIPVGAAELKLGAFTQTVIDFLIVAFAIFMALKVINRMKKEEVAAPAEPEKTPEDIVLLREIRDSLKK